MPSLELLGRQQVIRSVPANKVVRHFYVIEDILLRYLSRRVNPFLDKLLPQGVENAIYYCVIMAISTPAHTAFETTLF